jgi:hypothetical protein
MSQIMHVINVSPTSNSMVRCGTCSEKKTLKFIFITETTANYEQCLSYSFLSITVYFKFSAVH